jgi:hypothetical protein
MQATVILNAVKNLRLFLGALSDVASHLPTLRELKPVYGV